MVYIYCKSHLKEPEDRVLIFVPFTDLGKHLAQDLNCDFYGGEVKDPAKREATYLSWYHGHKNILVATSALSAGNDHPCVRLIVHFGTPKEMMSYVQEVSRGGRDGQSTKCLLIPMSKRNQSTPLELDEDHTGIEIMHQFIWDEADCLRYLITYYSDGVGVYCQDNPSQQKCSNCQAKHIATLQQATIINHPHSKTLSISNNPKKRKSPEQSRAFDLQLFAAKKAKTERSLAMLSYIKDFELCLAKFQSSCAYCTVFGNQPNNHSLFQCSLFLPHISEYKAWKKTIKYNKKYPNRSCWFCHIPQYHDQLHGTFGTAKDCVYPDIVAPVAFAIFNKDGDRMKAQAHFGVEWGSIDDFTKWLIGVPVKNEQTNISALFCWFAKLL